VVATAFVIVVAWYEFQVRSGSPGGRIEVVRVVSGAGTSSLIGDLTRHGVISSATAFRAYLWFHGPSLVQSGAYEFRQHENYDLVRSRIIDGPDVFDIEVPPGFTVAELADRVGDVPRHHQGAFARLATSGAVRSPWEPEGSTNLDGLMAPGTYQILPGESDRMILTQMIDRFDATANADDLRARAAALGVSPYQAITVASIVEKEGEFPENLGKVARVVYNRLAAGMPLQMNATVFYAEGRDGGAFTAADEDLDTPYNTYRYAGLTPTPICFPSQASLEAALAPPPGSWIYFVLVSKDGVEAFADTYAEQLANEALAASRGLG